MVQRRRFRRITVIQPATLLSQHTGSIAGEIRDFSPSGVLFALTRPVGTAALQNQLITIEFRPNLADTQQYRIIGRVVRIFDQSVGIVIEHFPANAYRDLVLLTNQPKQPVPTAATAGYSEAQISDALTQCHTRFKSFIAQVITHFYNSLSGKQAFSAEQTASMEERWLVQEAYPRIAMQRAGLERAFFDDDYLDRDMQDNASIKEENQPLALVDVDEFDDWLAVTQLVNRLNLEYSYEAGKFESRYAVLIGTQLSPNANPFGSHYIFQTFREVWAAVEFPHQVKALLYKTFHEAMMVFMDEFYRDLNEIVAFVQVSPLKPVVSESMARAVDTAAVNRVNARTGSEQSAAIPLEDYLQTQGPGTQHAARQRSSSSSSSATGIPGPNAALGYGLNQLLEQLHLSQNNGSGEPDYRALTDSLRGLQSGQARTSRWSDSVIPAMHQLLEAANPQLRQTGAAAPGGMQAGAVIDSDNLSQILGVLNVMQQRMLQGDVADEASIKRQLIDALPQFGNASMQDRFFHSVHLFDEMLSTPLSDAGLNSDIRGLLKKIELTLLKLALMDEDFLESSNHPAQQTVNLLERFYAAADDMGRIFDPRLQRLLNLLANQIVDQFEGKPDVFDEVNKVLDNLLIPIDDIRKSKVEQIQFVCQHREQRAGIEPAAEFFASKQNGETSEINLLRQDDWLSVMVDGVLAPYQLVWSSPSGRMFVMTSRSATTVREFTRQSLMQALATGQVIRLPEYDIPFMERSAHKLMLNAYERVYQQATHDPVSGLLNRKGMITQLDVIFANEDVQKRRGILCMLMFDQLSQLYHNCDAEEAEVSLMALIGLIANEVKSTDLFARLGENTFAILLHDSDLASAQANMQGLVAIIEQQRISCQGKQFVIGVNVGIAQIDAVVDSVSKLFKSVGSACVAAKAQGVNFVQIYEAGSALIRHEQSLFEWAGAIDQVFNDNLLFLRCQKIQPIDAGRGALPHYEILLGVNKHLTTNPQEFILAAEKWNRSADIDLWVLQQSFEWLAAQGGRLDALGGVSINLSGHSLANEKILAYIYQTLEARQIPADKVIFEITETAVISRLDSAQRFIETVRGFGCRFSLDDFGSGYSSFAYLKNLKADFLKIDGAFIRDLAKSPADLAMVKSMHQVAHALGLKTIAEYVENPVTLDMLGRIGVDYAQGHGIEASRALDTLVL
ncbi:DUF1631 family protein [Sulfuriferula sp. AH1]|uniref:DUF1631 family protein n=1 Tax=Sulfuriferula sp. AH1 TaxID=1985873 RepID=UPI001672CAB3|nr:DUF1631 family protein [Sulfuriferula sp. AH1]